MLCFGTSVEVGQLSPWAIDEPKSLHLRLAEHGYADPKHYSEMPDAGNGSQKVGMRRHVFHATWFGVDHMHHAAMEVHAVFCKLVKHFSDV